MAHKKRRKKVLDWRESDGWMWIINRSKISGRNNGKFQGKHRGGGDGSRLRQQRSRAPPRGIIYQFQLALNICRALARFTVMGHETRLFTELNCEIVGSGVGGNGEKRKSSAVLSRKGLSNFRHFHKGHLFENDSLSRLPLNILEKLAFYSTRNGNRSGVVRVVFVSDSNARRCGKEVYIYISQVGNENFVKFDN